MKFNPSSAIQDPAVLEDLQRLAAMLEVITADRLAVLHVAPKKPREGSVVICDGVSWNPVGGGIKEPVWFDGVVWNSF